MVRNSFCDIGMIKFMVDGLDYQRSVDSVGIHFLQKRSSRCDFWQRRWWFLALCVWKAIFRFLCICPHVEVAINDFCVSSGHGRSEERESQRWNDCGDGRTSESADERNELERSCGISHTLHSVLGSEEEGSVVVTFLLKPLFEESLS